MSIFTSIWDALLNPNGPDWAAMAIGFVFFVALPLAVYSASLTIDGWHRKQARKRREQARREAADWGEMQPDEWFQWRRLAGSYIAGETAPEPSREGRR